MSRGSKLTISQGKVAELRAELQNNGKKDKGHVAKKTALKKIVANMTMSNNDMIALFPDVISCMQIPVLEIKKMFVTAASILISLTATRCFLYLQNYARLKPDIALQALPVLREVSLVVLQNPSKLIILGSERH